MAPDYEPTSGAMRGNIVKLTMGDYLNEVPGIITKIDVDIPEDSSFDLARDLDGDIDLTTAQLPMLINLDISFTPLHNFIPQKVSDNYVKNPQDQNSMNSPFISLGNKNQGYYTTPTSTL